MCDSPFIVKLFETYNSPEHLYFLLELALGGRGPVVPLERWPEVWPPAGNQKLFTPLLFCFHAQD